MEQAPIHLTILRRGDTHIVDLAEVGSLIPRSETQVDDAFLDDLTAEIMRLAAPGYGTRAVSETPGSVSLPKPTTVREDLQRVGELIFSHLLTEPARKRLRTAEPCDLYLRLDERLVQIPWELGHDGKEFLATKFRVGRQVITGAPLPDPREERKVKEVLKVLLIVDPTESLPEANREAEQLCSLLDTIPKVEVTLLGGKQVRKIPLLGALPDHDVVHFAGHSHYDPEHPSKSGWRLQEGVLTAGELSKLHHAPLLVFSNSCQAGATAAWAKGYRYEGQAFGIGSAFLLAGVRNYLGTFWVVHDEESVLFATTFYQNLVAGLSLGEAVLSARHAVLQHKGWNGLTWASYMLYGDPAFTLLPTLEHLQHSAPPASERLRHDHSSEPRMKPGARTRFQDGQEGNSVPKIGRISLCRQWLSQSRPLLVVLSVAGLLLMLGGIKLMRSLFFSPFNAVRTTRTVEPPPLSPAPDKLSIAVLPFVNMGEDPKNDYFSDGITEDLITDLSKLSSLFVIARNSSFFYKGKAVKLEQISQELGVRYVLEGSVRKMDNLVRITVQLADATTGYHLWAERYDRPLHDIFALQDEISRQVVAALKVALTPGDQGRLGRTPTTNLEAYDHVLRGWAYARRSTRESNAQARQMFAKAIELDPAYADAYAALSTTYLLEWIWQWNQSLQTLAHAFDSAQRASLLDHSLPLAHMVLGNVSLWQRQYEHALAAAEKSIALDPNYAEGYATLGEILTWVGKPQEAVRWVEKAIRLNPHYPSDYFWILGHAYRLMGAYEAAITTQLKVLSHSPDHIGAHTELAVSYSELGRGEKARAEVAEILRTSPQASLKSLRHSLPYKDQAVLERYLSNLRVAGLPQ